MKFLALWGVFFYSVCSFALTEDEVQQLSVLQSPYIQGDTLYIKGPMDSHIYNYFAYEAKKMKDVKVIELSSFGGNLEWAMMAANYIKNYYNVTTRIAPGQFCASACVPLFAAGKKRVIAPDAGIGIHSARFGASYRTNFDGLCMMELEGGKTEFNQNLKGCREFISKWYSTVETATLEMFDFYEANGTSVELRDYYFSLPLQPDWYLYYNVMKTPDWVVSPQVALQYNLATEIGE